MRLLNNMEKINVSPDDLRYLTSLRAWNETVFPFWLKELEKYKRCLDVAIRRSDLQEIKYYSGYFDGYREATKVVDLLLKNQRLKTRLSSQVVNSVT